MTLAQLIAAVYTETNRPDLVAETLQSVLESTLSLHTIDNWYKDVTEAIVVFDIVTQFVQTLDVGALPFFRSMSYIRKYGVPITTSFSSGVPIGNFAVGVDAVGNTVTTLVTSPTANDFFERVDVGDVLDSYGYEKVNIWYQAGKQLNMKSSTQLQAVIVGYYKYPIINTTGANYASWIAEEQPFALIYKAAGSLFAKIGEDKSYAMYMKPPTPGQGEETGGLYYQQLAQLRRNNIIASGW
jgi:hypothetical protein